MNTHLPKKIWFLWLQGFDSAPLLVRNCYNSWVKYNPGWTVIFLHEGNVKDYLKLEVANITKQAYSDLLRVNLMAQYGGVWADATCFCNRPLDEWLYNHLGSGFFAFSKPVPGRIVSSWFLAGNKYNYIINTLCIKSNAYWTENNGMRFIEESIWRFLSKYLERHSPSVWFGRLVTKTLKVYPYFWIHYMFEHLYLHDTNFKEMWDNTQVIAADVPHTIFFSGMYKPLTEDIKQHIDSKTAPVYKLTWKFTPPDDLSGTVMEYLFDTLS